MNNLLLTEEPEKKVDNFIGFLKKKITADGSNVLFRSSSEWNEWLDLAKVWFHKVGRVFPMVIRSWA